MKAFATPSACHTTAHLKRRMRVFLPLALILTGALLIERASAQTFTVVHNFGARADDGTSPRAGLVLSDGTLYGTTLAGGSFDDGAVFAIGVDGTGITNLYSFTGYPDDGASPYCDLVLSNNTLYGTAQQGGATDFGTVFVIDTNGTGFTNVHSCDFPSESGYPHSGLIFVNGKLYGTEIGNGNGSHGQGVVFALNTDGTGFTNVYSFSPVNNSTNSDGAVPFGGLVCSGNTLYGTTYYGGTSGYGTVFAVNTDGTGFTNLHNFTGGAAGSGPFCRLSLSGIDLYGTTSGSGLPGTGTVFRVHTDGTGFTNLHIFAAIDKTNSDGAYPYAGLLLTGHTLYGTAVFGGASGNGTIFTVNTDGTEFTNLHSFTALSKSSLYSASTNSDGACPYGGLILSSNTLYGTASGGGAYSKGTIFSLFIPPPLTLVAAGPNMILSWPTNAAGFALQSTTNLASPVWTAVLPDPVVINGQNTVTGSVSATEQYYRLSR